MPARKTIGIRALKNDLSRVVNEVAEGGDEYVITHRDQPKAVLRPWREEDQHDERAARRVEILEQILRTAKQVAAAATDHSAAAAVAEQRR